MFIHALFIDCRIYALFVAKSSSVPKLGGGEGLSQFWQCQDLGSAFCWRCSLIGAYHSPQDDHFLFHWQTMAKGLDLKLVKACTRSRDLMVNCIRDHQILGVPSCSLRTLDNRPESGQSLAARHKQPSLMHCHTILTCVCMQIVKQKKEATPLLAWPNRVVKCWPIFPIQNDRITQNLPIWEMEMTDWLRQKLNQVKICATHESQYKCVGCFLCLCAPLSLADSWLYMLIGGEDWETVGRVQSDWWHSSSSLSIPAGWSETGIGGGWTASVSESEIFARLGRSETGSHSHFEDKILDQVRWFGGLPVWLNCLQN